MAVVLIDQTNKIWAMENPLESKLYVGRAGQPGFRLEEVLAFIESKRAQFEKFLQKKPAEKVNAKRTVA